MVAAADKTHNLATLVAAHQRHGAAVWRAFKALPRDTIRFYEDTLAVLRARVPAALIQSYEEALQAARALTSEARRTEPG